MSSSLPPLSGVPPSAQGGGAAPGTGQRGPGSAKLMGASGRPLAGAASRGYSVASVWETSAALTDTQMKLLDQLASCCSARAVPLHVVDDLRTAPGAAREAGAAGAADPAGGSEAYVGTLDDAVLHNINQFHKWHSELEAACASEMEEKYKRYADLLNSHLQTCEGTLAKVDRTIEFFDALLALHRDVSQRSRALHSSCEQLVREKDQLTEFADAIRTRLKFFDEFEMVSAQFQKAQLSLDNSDQYLQLMKRLDDGLAFVASNPQYADAGAYTLKFRQLQGKALGAVRNKVQQVLKAAVQQVQQAIQESQPKAPGTGAQGAGSASASASGQSPQLAEGAEVPLLYVRFRAAAEPSLKGLLREVEARSGRPEYQRLLAECQQLYCAARQQLVAPVLAQRLQAELAGQQLTKITRLGCEHLLRVCQLEWQLFEHFFPPPAGSAPAPAPMPSSRAGGMVATSAKQQAAQDALQALAEPLCMLLYDVLRPQVVVMQDIDELCELADVLKHEVLGDQLAKRGGGGEALRPMLDRLLADVQGRIIYRCQAFIKEEVSAYVPTAEDVDYPAKLERPIANPDGVLAAAGVGPSGRSEGGAAAASSSNGKGSGAGEANGNGSGPSGTDANGAASEGGSQQDQQQQQLQRQHQQPQRPPPDPYSLLYPPLRATLLCLSKLYRAVDSKTFGGLAQEAVSACTLSVQQASRQVARKSGPLDAQLFMVKHLLFLREQIAPFDVDFSAVDIDLDFTHMREQLRRIMAGETSLFAFGSNNAMVRMLGSGGPRVLTYQVDSKKELEKHLKGVCEAFIMAATKVAVEPMLSFITKVTAVRVAAQAHGGAAAAQHKPLREQAFAAPQKVAEVVAKVNEALTGALPATIGKMRQYLPNPSTHAILFKPVKSNIAEAHGQVASLLAQEYTPEEAAQVPLKQPHELAAVLDAMC